MLPYVGCLVAYFLPPYSVDLNPIECLYRKVKSVLKANDEAWSNFTVQTTLALVLNSITEEDWKSWFLYRGYHQE